MQTACQVVCIIVQCASIFVFFWQHVSLASTLGLAEDFKSISKVSRIMILLKCISIMIHFGKCIKYQYRDTILILNQVSVSVSRYNLEVSYPTLQTGGFKVGQLNDVEPKSSHITPYSDLYTGSSLMNAYKILNTSQSDYLHNLPISVQSTTDPCCHGNKIWRQNSKINKTVGSVWWGNCPSSDHQ